MTALIDRLLRVLCEGAIAASVWDRSRTPPGFRIETVHLAPHGIVVTWSQS